ncbi:MAG: hypothetical protein O2973_12460 [Gemmatimonadetes bacterium]|nr:hypothetical protein [Gemmatimonadota bacterium]
MLGFIALLVTLFASWIGFGGARRFVRDRLRYVESALSPAAPVFAGVVAALVAAPIVYLLPLIGGGTALIFGVSVALGVRSGASDVKRGYLVSSGN